MRRFVFDCDTGTDDAIALLAAFGSPEIEILGITSVNGNVIEDHVANNNLNLCEYLGFDVPVTRGASMPLFSGYHNSLDMTHGTTGLGSVVMAGPVMMMNTIPEAKPFLDKLGFSEGYKLRIIVGLGYPDESPDAKPRDLDKIKFIE